MKDGNKQGNSNLQKEFAAGYLYRCLEETINDFTTQVGGEISGPELADRMGTLLCRKARGQVLGSPDSMPILRGQTATGDTSLESVEVVSSSRGQAPVKGRHLTLKARLAIGRAKKRWWKNKQKNKPMKKIHWTQTKKGREYMSKTARQRFEGKKVAA